MKPLAPNVCEAVMVQRIEDKGNIPKKVFNLNVGRYLKTMNDLKRYVGRAMPGEERSDEPFEHP